MRKRSGKAKSFAFVAAATEEAQTALMRLQRTYGEHDPEQADIVVALGGDGFMLETLHRFMQRGVPIFGMNCGTVGFLMNRYDEHDLGKRLANAHRERLHPLLMVAKTVEGRTLRAHAINEVALTRQTRQASKIGIRVDGVIRLAELICDGVLIATPAGSTAYNLSAGGQILPLGSAALALTPISPFRPRHWRGAILPHSAKVTFDVHEFAKRPASAVADFTEVRDVTEVQVREDRRITLNLLFDPEHNLEERILAEQFAP